MNRIYISTFRGRLLDTAVAVIAAVLWTLAGKGLPSLQNIQQPLRCVTHEQLLEQFREENTHNHHFDKFFMQNRFYIFTLRW